MALYYGNQKVGELIISARDATSAPISLATPTIQVNSTSGVVTAMVNQPVSGYLSAGQTSASVNILAAHADPIVAINSSSGTISARHTQVSGYVTAGTTTATLSLQTVDGATITPSSVTQIAAAAHRWTTGQITVSPIPSNYLIPTGNLNITNNNTTVNVAPYSTATINISITPGSVSTNNVVLPSGTTVNGTIASGNYIKISAGYYAEDMYFQAT